jgi:ABC-type amino acid transport substrate-binding protein
VWRTEFVRSLPASGAAPALAAPVVDLATGNRVPREVAQELRALAGALLTEAAASVDQDTVELRVRTDPDSVRLEVRGEAAGFDMSLPREVSAGEDAEALVRIDYVADRWGLSHRDGHYCLWAEKSTGGFHSGRFQPN